MNKWTFSQICEKDDLAHTDKIKDVWGKEYPISDIDVILTISQFKMWKQYENWQDYLYYFNKYWHSCGCSRVNKEKDDEFVLTNYLYLPNKILVL